MIKSIISSLFISSLLIIPLLLKTIGMDSEIIYALLCGLNPLLIFLIIFNFLGLICLQTVAKFANFIDTKDLLEHSKEQEKLENSLGYKIYKVLSLSLFFGLTMYNGLYLTTIFGCIWWLSNHFFKINFDKFVKDIE